MTILRPDLARPAPPPTALVWTAPVWLTLRTDLRRKWRAMLGLALLLGLIGGVVLSATAGARRTGTAYPRLLASANASQLDVIPTVNNVVPEDYYRALGRLPQVASMATAVLRYRPGTDRAAAAAVAARLTAAVQAAGCPPGQCPVISEQRPGDIEDYASVRDTRLVLAAVLIVLAVGTLAHVLLTTVRRRRRDLAVLKALGLHQAPGPRPGRLGGQHVRRRGAAVRAAARRPGRPARLGGLHQRRGRLPGRRRAARLGAARHPGHPAARQPHRDLAGLDRRPRPPGRRAAHRVARAALSDRPPHSVAGLVGLPQNLPRFPPERVTARLGMPRGKQHRHYWPQRHHRLSGRS